MDLRYYHFQTNLSGKLFNFWCLILEIYELFRCRGLIILETYTTLRGDDLKLPDFLDVDREVTGAHDFSMYTLSCKKALPAPVEKLAAVNGPEVTENGPMEVNGDL